MQFSQTVIADPPNDFLLPNPQFDLISLRMQFNQTAIADVTFH